jgi:hypothetical protein
MISPICFHNPGVIALALPSLLGLNSSVNLALTADSSTTTKTRTLSAFNDFTMALPEVLACTSSKRRIE